MHTDLIVTELVKALPGSLSFVKAHPDVRQDDEMRAMVLESLAASPGLAAKGQRVTDAALALVTETLCAVVENQVEEIQDLRERLSKLEGSTSPTKVAKTTKG